MHQGESSPLGETTPTCLLPGSKIAPLSRLSSRRCLRRICRGRFRRDLGSSRRRARIAGPQYGIPVHPRIRLERLEHALAVALRAEVVPRADAEDEIRAVLHGSLQDRKERLHARTLSFGFHDEMIRQVLPADPPARTVVLKFLEGAANVFAPHHFSLPQVVERRVLRETPRDSLGVAGINRPSVLHEKLHDVEPVIGGKFCIGTGHGGVSLFESQANPIVGGSRDLCESGPPAIV
jgi:hypothetical protein